MPLAFSVCRSAASAAEVEATLARFDREPGIYFGCDAGVPGLHPLQATVLVAPSLAIRVYEDGAEVDALDALGRALLRQATLAPFVAEAKRGPGRSAVVAARAFLAAFEGAADALLVGALRFEAHRLGAAASRAGRIAPSATATGTSAPLGILFFAAEVLRRDAGNAWQRVALHFDDADLAAARQSDREAPASIDATADAGDAGDAARAIRDDFPPGGYATVVAEAVAWLEREPLVSLTLSQSFRRRMAGASAARAFAVLRRDNPAPATFFVNAGEGERLFGASPDLQLVVRGGHVESFPVCGTVARGHGPVGESESLRQLLNEEVDAASLAVCTDALRNDLAPLCEPGSLRLLDRRRPMALATVLHTVDRFHGRLRAGVDAWDAIVATAAPVMLTGTPRHLALAAIEALEAGPRGWYGGLALQVGADGDALVGTILRAALLGGGVAEVRTGGDLMADSDPAREEHESRVKAVSLWRALGLPVEAGLQASIAGLASAPNQRVERLPPAVALVDAGDPFAAAVAETLLGMQLRLDAATTPVVLIGADPARCFEAAARGSGLVAIGDAAARVLQHAGFAVASIRPEHGRSMRCVPQADAPWSARRAFTAMRYATLGVDLAPARWPADGANWVTWVCDEHERPVMLAHPGRRTVCLLLRPDSLLADREARDALLAAIAFVTNPGPLDAASKASI